MPHGVVGWYGNQLYKILVPGARFELATSGLWVLRSNQLSYPGSSEPTVSLRKDKTSLSLLQLLVASSSPVFQTDRRLGLKNCKHVFNVFKKRPYDDFIQNTVLIVADFPC